MKIKIIDAIPNSERGRIFIRVKIDDKVKCWNVAKGLYKVLVKLIEGESNGK